MAASVGNAVSINVGGTSTVMTAEAMAGAGAGPYQVTAAGKRVIDPAVAVAFYEGGVLIASSEYLTVDYFFGTVTFTGAKAGAITVTAQYIPLLAVVKAHSHSIAVKTAMLDSTGYEDGMDTTCLPGLRTLTASIECYDTGNVDLDAGAGTVTWYSMTTGQVAILVDIDTDGTATKKYRFWAYIPGLDISGAVDALIGAKIEFQATDVITAAGTRTGGFAVGY